METSEHHKEQVHFSPWAEGPEETLEYLGTSAEEGLSSSQVKSKQEEYGKNELKAEKKVTNFSLLVRQFKNPMVYTLFFASLGALFLGEYIDSVAIMLVLVINAIIGYIQESKATSALEALKKMSVPKAKVLREGQLKVVDSIDIVPGDIIMLEAGDLIPADARVLETYQLTADEAPLTGESMPVAKTASAFKEDTLLADRKNMLHSGTALSNGSGKAVVTAVGMSTEMGHIAGMLEDTGLKETPLQKRLNLVTKKLIFLGVIVIMLVIALRYFAGDPWFLIFMSAISLAVAAIPEGLPTVVTLALTLAVRRMTRRNAIVRNMSSIETLGSTDVICTDKTGTLTTGNMTVRETFLLDESVRQRFMEALVLCNNASIGKEGSGDTTERALLEFAAKEGKNFEEVNLKLPREHEWSFDSERKRMSVAVKADDGMRIITKGAPETMMERCRLDEISLGKIREEIDRMTSKGQRLLAVAEKKGEVLENAEVVEKDLTFLGLVAMADPPKPETIPAIKECQEAGIKVVMITGDHPATAKAIGQELGIVIPGKFEKVLTGKEVEKLDSDALRSKVEETAVYARVSPAHKLRIVEALQKNGHVVAMTGDGVNDAPALKKAQIGVAMGKAGTEVARQASSMVLTDDNFSTIVAAVEEGRSIYLNIKHTIQYLFSTNLALIFIVLGATILGLPVPFVPLGLLWINLVTDGLPALALAAEPLDKNILKSSRRPSPSTFFDKMFIRELLLTAVLITAISLGLYYYQVDQVGVVRARSMAFFLVVFLCFMRSFSCRSETKTYFELKPNVYHLVSIFVPLLLQVGLQYTETYQNIFEVVPITISEIMFLLALSLIPPAAVEIQKLLMRRKQERPA